jgi:hypothetical protein
VKVGLLGSDDPSSNGFTVANGINNMGEIVGDYEGATGPIHGFTYNLSTNTWQTIDDPNASLSSATFVNGINDLGDLEVIVRMEPTRTASWPSRFRSPRPG